MPQLLKLCAATTEIYTPGACAPQQEKPLQWEAYPLPQRGEPLLVATRESPGTETKTQHGQK